MTGVGAVVEAVVGVVLGVVVDLTFMGIEMVVVIAWQFGDSHY